MNTIDILKGRVLYWPRVRIVHYVGRQGLNKEGKDNYVYIIKKARNNFKGLWINFGEKWYLIGGYK